jgi:hypothetical protein
MRSKAWLAARVSLRLARMPRHAWASLAFRACGSARPFSRTILYHTDKTYGISDTVTTACAKTGDAASMERRRCELARAISLKGLARGSASSFSRMRTLWFCTTPTLFVCVDRFLPLSWRGCSVLVCCRLGGGQSSSMYLIEGGGRSLNSFALLIPSSMAVSQVCYCCVLMCMRLAFLARAPLSLARMSCLALARRSCHLRIGCCRADYSTIYFRAECMHTLKRLPLPRACHSGENGLTWPAFHACGSASPFRA